MREQVQIEVMLTRAKTFSLDLSQAILRQIRILYIINSTKEPIIEKSIDQYRSEFPQPTSQYLFGWPRHLHRLRPHIYEKDVNQRKMSLDLFEAHKRQKSMLKYGSELYYTTSKMDSMIDNYYRFLLLAADTKEILVPTPEIDLVWHAHLDHHKNYKEDVIKITGRFLDHDDTIPEDTLEQQRHKTNQLWKEKYGKTDSNGSSCGVVLACGTLSRGSSYNDGSNIGISGSSCSSSCGSSCGGGCGS